MIYIARNWEQEGPFEAAEVRRMHEAGEIPPDTRYWQEGMQDWRPIHEFMGLPPETPEAAKAREEDYAKFHNLGSTLILVWLLWGAAFSLYLLIAWHSSTGAEVAVFATLEASSLPRVSSAPWVLPTLYTAIGTGLTGWIFFLLWVYRAQLNLRFLGARDRDFSPGWAVGWFFIPLANLVKPFEMMTQLAERSRAPSMPSRPWRQMGALILFWWITHIAGGGLRLSMASNSPAFFSVILIARSLNYLLPAVIASIITFEQNRHRAAQS
ncbi:MAG: hypothetical protein E1N59_3319 [Puniceicoccaceae bacterium 5H]|nr:MAG: hypothetical protein E1N59_3319 [Puniceicoccaceae bacterium 5H]